MTYYRCINDILLLQVKLEPIDPIDDLSAVDSYSSVGVTSATVSNISTVHGFADSRESMVHMKVQKILEDKTVDSITAAQSIQNVIEDMVKNNEYLLSMTDALKLKPHSRRGLASSETSHSKETNSHQASKTVAHSSNSHLQDFVTRTNVPSTLAEGRDGGQMLRPRSPTDRCMIQEADMSQLTLALIESNVGSEEAEGIFHVQKHEMVCAISSPLKYVTSDGHHMATVDISYYWCNFCPFSTSSKPDLMNHVMTHRFNCKHCPYQSFSRADVVRHSAERHVCFQQTAASTQYCTLLSDFLHIQALKRKVDSGELDETVQSADEDESTVNVVLPQPSGKNASEMLTGHFNHAAHTVQADGLHNEEEETADDSRPVPFSAPCSASLQGSSLEPPSVTVPESLDPNLKVTNICSEGKASLSYAAQASPSNILPNEVPLNGIPQHISSSSNNCKNSRSHPTASLHSRNRLGSGSMRDLRSNLHWSCGYCSFSSPTQGAIKTHSVKQHAGKSCRYIALIKPKEPPKKSCLQHCGQIEQSGHVTEHALDTATNGICGQAECLDHGDSSSSVRGSLLREHLTTVKQEACLPDSADALMKVRLRLPCAQTKSSSSLKCYHCDYNSNLPAHLHNHILTDHEGKCVVGVCGATDQMFMCGHPSCTFRSSSASLYLKHAARCAYCTQSDHSPDQAGLRGRLLESMQKTASVAEEALSTLHQPAGEVAVADLSKVSTEQFMCNYCQCYFSSDKQIRKHLLMCHASEQLDMHDVSTDHKRKSSSVFFCRCCPWEGTERVAFDRHVRFCLLQTQHVKDDGHKHGHTGMSVSDEKSCRNAGTTGSGTAPAESDPADCTVVGNFSGVEHIRVDDSHTADLHIQCVEGNRKGCVRGAESSILQMSSIRGCLAFDDLHNTHAVSLTLKGGVKPKTCMAFSDAEVATVPPAEDVSNLVSRSCPPDGDGNVKAIHGRSSADSSVSMFDDIPVKEIRCSRCDLETTSLDFLKFHFQARHSTVSIKFVSLEHKKLNLKSKFFVCPFDSCIVYESRESRMVKHYREFHRGQPHPSLSSGPFSITGKSRPCKFSRSADGDGSASVEVAPHSTVRSYMCLYCDDYHYAGCISDMKLHYETTHAGQDMIIRDVSTLRSRRYSRLSVCPAPRCQFSSFSTVALQRHLKDCFAVRSTELAGRRCEDREVDGRKASITSAGGSTDGFLDIDG